MPPRHHCDTASRGANRRSRGRETRPFRRRSPPRAGDDSDHRVGFADSVQQAQARPRTVQPRANQIKHRVHSHGSAYDRAYTWLMVRSSSVARRQQSAAKAGTMNITCERKRLRTSSRNESPTGKKPRGRIDGVDGIAAVPVGTARAEALRSNVSEKTNGRNVSDEGELRSVDLRIVSVSAGTRALGELAVRLERTHVRRQCPHDTRMRARDSAGGAGCRASLQAGAAISTR